MGRGAAGRVVRNAVMATLLSAVGWELAPTPSRGRKPYLKRSTELRQVEVPAGRNREAASGRAYGGCNPTHQELPSPQPILSPRVRHARPGRRRDLEMQGSGAKPYDPEEHRRGVLVHLPGVAEPVAADRTRGRASTSASSAATRPRRRASAARCRSSRSSPTAAEDVDGTAARCSPSVWDRRARPDRLVDEREARRRARVLGRQAVPLAPGQHLPRPGLVHRRAADDPLDGELWIARKQFDRASEHRPPPGHSRTGGRRSSTSSSTRPTRRRPFEERLKFLQDGAGGWKNPFAAIHDHEPCNGLGSPARGTRPRRGARRRGADAPQAAVEVRADRSSTLLKVKRFHDAEAIVIGYEAGQGAAQGPRRARCGCG